MPFSQITVGQHGMVESFPAAAQKFSYDATEPKGRRKSPVMSSRSEDDILMPFRRSQLTASSRDLQRNYAILAWMLRCHLNYVTSFAFHAKTDDDDFNDALESRVVERSKKENADVRGRFSLGQITRLSELRSLVDGDLGVMKLKNLQLQAIEGDRIRDPDKKQAKEKWVNGVLVDDAGKPIGYAIHSRSLGTFKFDRVISAENFYLLGHFDRFDQTRGITPISSALNSMRDVYENIEQALLKAKVHNQFGLKIKRGASDSMGEVDEEGNASGKTSYKVDFGSGPFVLDLDPADDAEFMMSAHPPHEFQDFMTAVIMITLRALDLPYSFFDESHTNFFGSRGAWLHYERSCQPKRERISDMLNWITEWWVRSEIVSGKLKLPKKMRFEDIVWDWVPAGMPWWKPSEEINGDVQAIRAGLTSPQRVCRERGTGDVFDNLIATSKVIEHAQKLGVQLSFDPVPIQMQVVANDDSTK